MESSSRMNTIENECTKRYECINCTQGRVCKPNADKGGFDEVYRFDCTGNTPFCNVHTGSCTSTQSVECVTKNEFLCLSDGIFPLQDQCNEFYYCKDQHSYRYKCASGVYNPRTTKCEDHNVCTKFDCHGRNGMRIAHPLAPEYFAYCANDRVAVVDKCKETHVFINEQQKCVHFLKSRFFY